MDVVGISRPALVAMIAAAVLLFAGGVTWAASWLTRHTETRSRTLAGASTIEIQARSGDIDVVGTDRSDIRLTTKEHRSVFGSARVSVDYRAGRLRLDEDCSGADLFGNSCSVSYRLEIPRDATVRLVTRSGDVTAEDLSRDADLQTTSGDVEALDVLGALRAHTTSGDVHVEAASTDIDAQTTSGDVDVLARDAVRVRAQTTSGDVHVRVPDRTYAVEARASSGDEDVDVRVDDAAPRRIDASTTSGDVHVEPGA
jgi:DUF4097 and DUF4098 domain-containing protein YvlB